jgi:hypothetical protein
MKKIIINIPIYCCKVTVIVCKDLSLVAKKYNLTEDVTDFGSFTFKDESSYRHYVMVLQDDWRSNVVHELVHVVNHIYLDCAMQLDRHNDEPQAYLMGWLFDKIDNFLKQIKSDESHEKKKKIK